ncbi:MAG: cysteine--tRNA ligase [Planctomycetes bacterium]|nr:cysteine--tRNA ligase [Planctomycetota bacterium]
MGLVIFNTLTREKQPFVPVQPGKVGIYLCGPTVYKPSHVGHAVGPIIFDAVKRYLVHCGFEVRWVVNITDVDDKLIVEAEKQNTTTIELAERITKDYLDAMKILRVDTIDIMPKASEHIGDIIDFIKRLEVRDIAYESGGDVYFDVTKDADYGKLSNRRIEDQAGQRDLQSAEKRNPADFALWKAAKPEEPEDVKFDSPWGKGRPGWHIECSAMAMRYLGETFDIHGGGVDLVFPHHENEIAQSESATDKPFAKFWMHNGLTKVNTKKISKSDADPEMQAVLQQMTLHNLLDEYPGELIRFFILSTQYRSPIEYSQAEIASKRKGLDTFYRLFERVARLCGVSPYEKATELGEPGDDPGAGVASDVLAKSCVEQTALFKKAMDDDFNTAGAIAALFDFAGIINRVIEQEKIESGGNVAVRRAPDAAKADVLTATARLISVARLIGVFLDPPDLQAADRDGLIDKAMNVLIQVRQHVRKNKDFTTADLIRDLLKEQGITLEDRADGTGWRKD